MDNNLYVPARKFIAHLEICCAIPRTRMQTNNTNNKFDKRALTESKPNFISKTKTKCLYKKLEKGYD